VKDSDVKFTIFTTRADTMFGVTFMVLAPESDYVAQVTTPEQKAEVDKYLDYVKSRTELDRMSDHKVTGVFSGSYAVNPFTGDAIPIWISEYVLAGYGTGAIMAVPAHDSRDYAFAKHFNLPIIPLIEGADVSEESFDAKEGIVMNSPRPGHGNADGFSLNGCTVKEAIAKTKKYVTEKGIGRVKVNYRLRDAIFSRQRYWGEPFPVYYDNGIPKMVPEECLPVELPEITEYKPTEDGEPPLGRATKWAWDTVAKKVVENSRIDNKTIFPLDLYTMPGFAGSSAYYLRYMDPHNDKELVGKEADEYWRHVDLYVGGTEHATGHLIYSRFWNKFLHDYGVSCEEEPFQKLINQGMIQGRSNFVYRVNELSTADKPVFVSYNLRKDYKDVTPIHVWINLVKNDILDIEAFRKWSPEYKDAEFIFDDGSKSADGANGKYVCGWAIEKMSKSMYNVVNPDDIVRDYGADTLRLYEMFLGPVEASKPWDTNGIDGCFRFLKKLWALFYENRTDKFLVNDDKPSAESLKSVHKLIKKVTGDIEAFSYNTSISAFMICVNELGQQKCHNRELLSDIVVLIAPFAPHIAEELWHQLGNTTSVCDATWPTWDEKYLVENEIQMTVSFNGKARFQKMFAADADKNTIEKETLADDRCAKYLEGKEIKKVIVVPKRIINIVVK
jgi:leucyl-tRNA synthetase